MRTGQVNIEIDATLRCPLRRIWRYVGYDEPNYTYTPDGRELLDTGCVPFVEIGFMPLGGSHSGTGPPLPGALRLAGSEPLVLGAVE